MRKSLETTAGGSAGRVKRRADSQERFDVGVGTFASNVAMYFIILTTALTLHTHGMTHLATSRSGFRAPARSPVRLATLLLYSRNVLGTGALATFRR